MISMLLRDGAPVVCLPPGTNAEITTNGDIMKMFETKRRLFCSAVKILERRNWEAVAAAAAVVRRSGRGGG